MADVVVLAKADAADPGSLERVAESARAVNPRAAQVRTASPVTLDDPAAVRAKRVLVVEDGPTITHGGMPHGAAFAAALANAAHVVDPRPWAAPDIAAVYAQYPHIGAVLPAMGYSGAQLAALRATLNSAEAEVIVAGTPIDLGALIEVNKPVVRARYELAEIESPGLWDAVERFLAHSGRPRA
jgi:predicted GTPase